MRGWSEWAREHLGPPLIGIMFWAFALLIVVMATASAKNSILRDFLAGFGSLAQVAIAYAVWKVSREQLAFTKAFNERQYRLQAFPERSALYKRYRELTAELYPHKVSDDSFENFMMFTNEMRPVFSRATMIAVNALVEITGRVLDAKGESDRIEFVDGQMRVMPTDEVKVLRKPWRESFSDANNAIAAELSLDPYGVG